MIHLENLTFAESLLFKWKIRETLLRLKSYMRKPFWMIKMQFTITTLMWDNITHNVMQALLGHQSKQETFTEVLTLQMNLQNILWLLNLLEFVSLQNSSLRQPNFTRKDNWLKKQPLCTFKLAVLQKLINWSLEFQVMLFCLILQKQKRPRNNTEKLNRFMKEPKTMRASFDWIWKY